MLKENTEGLFQSAIVYYNCHKVNLWIFFLRAKECEFQFKGETKMEDNVSNFYSTCKVKKE